MTLALFKIVTSRIPADGMSYWPVVFVRPAWANNPGLFVHEDVHLKEQILPHLLWWLALAVAAWHVPSWWLLLAAPFTPWWLCYLLWPAFRLRTELAAYRAQMRADGITLDEAARNLSGFYRLNLSMADAKRLLQPGDA